MRVWLHYGVSVGLLVAVLPLPDYVSQHTLTPLRQSLGALAYRIDGWEGRDEVLTDRVREVLAADDLLLREYVDATGRRVWLYVNYFASQHQGEISHSPKNCLPGAGWQAIDERRISYPLAGAAGQINEIVFERGGRRQLVLYWFRERDRILASEYEVKWYLVWDILTRRQSNGALLRVSTPIDDSREAARARSLDFMRAVLPRLDELFPQ
jgi:EpsI family protein